MRRPLSLTQQNALWLVAAFVDVAVLRWQRATGKQATLDGDGRTFDAIAQERAAT